MNITHTSSCNAHRAPITLLGEVAAVKPGVRVPFPKSSLLSSLPVSPTQVLSDLGHICLLFRGLTASSWPLRCRTGSVGRDLQLPLFLSPASQSASPDVRDVVSDPMKSRSSGPTKSN